MPSPFLTKLLFSIARDELVQKHELIYLFWECTLRCNLNCLHCGSDCLCKSETKDMPLSDFLKALDDIKEKNLAPNMTVCITGGEPLLRADLETAGKEIVSRGFHWGLVTNGLLLSEKRFASLIESGISTISISLDGFEKEHNFLRQHEHSFEKSLAAIKTVLNFLKHNPKKIGFDVITCVHRGNLESLPAFRDFLMELGLRNWRIFSIFPSGRAADNDLSLNPDEYRKLMDFIAESRKLIHVNYSCEGFLGKYELKVRDTPFYCKSGINIGAIFCDGTIGGCLSVRNESFRQGNIYGDSFSDVWNSKFQSMRDRSWAKSGRCAKCRKWKLCQGGALHLRSKEQNDAPFCNYEILVKS